MLDISVRSHHTPAVPVCAKVYASDMIKLAGYAAHRRLSVLLVCQLSCLSTVLAVHTGG